MLSVPTGYDHYLALTAVARAIGETVCGAAFGVSFACLAPWCMHPWCVQATEAVAEHSILHLAEMFREWSRGSFKDQVIKTIN